MKFMLGFFVGLAGALLFAPARGEETRSRLIETGHNLANRSASKLNQTVEQVSETAREKAGEIGSAVGRQAAEAVADSVLGKNPEARTA
jgi:gas vesicle protein